MNLSVTLSFSHSFHLSYLWASKSALEVQYQTARTDALSGISRRRFSNWYAMRTSNNTTIYMDLEESSGSALRIRSDLKFYLPLAFNRDRSYSLPSFFPPLVFLSFFHVHSLFISFHSNRRARHHISEVLSHIQQPQNPTSTDRQSSLTSPSPSHPIALYLLDERLCHVRICHCKIFADLSFRCTCSLLINNYWLR